MVSLSLNDGVVLALGGKAFKEVIASIGDKLNEKPLFKPDYGVAYEVKK